MENVDPNTCSEDFKKQLDDIEWASKYIDRAQHERRPLSVGIVQKIQSVVIEKADERQTLVDSAKQVLKSRKISRSYSTKIEEGTAARKQEQLQVLKRKVADLEQQLLSERVVMQPK